jgi:hypothetical protein
MRVDRKIAAVVTSDRDKVGGGAPIFYAHSAEEMQKLAFTLEKITDATAHDLKNGVIILFHH